MQNKKEERQSLIYVHTIGNINKKIVAFNPNSLDILIFTYGPLSDWVKNNSFFCLLSEPLRLFGEGQYNLNEIKEMKVTDSFLTLKPKSRSCQNIEDFEEQRSKSEI